MGEEWCGSCNPTRSLLTFYNCFDVFSLFLNEQGEKGKERRGRCFGLFRSLFTPLLAYGLWALFDLPENKSFEH